MILIDEIYLPRQESTGELVTQWDAAQLRSENRSLQRHRVTHSSTREAVTNPLQNSGAQGKQTESKAGGKAHLH